MCLCVNTYLARFNFFFFNDTATTEIYTLSLHDALPIYQQPRRPRHPCATGRPDTAARTCRRVMEDSIGRRDQPVADRKSTRLNSSHANISYAVFCLKKKQTNMSNFFIRLDKNIQYAQS